MLGTGEVGREWGSPAGRRLGVHDDIAVQPLKHYSRGTLQLGGSREYPSKTAQGQIYKGISLVAKGSLRNFKPSTEKFKAWILKPRA